MIDSFITEFFNKFTFTIGNFFNTEFWTMVGYTGIAVGVSFFLGYFFPALRSFAGALLIGIAGMWYGFHKGQKSRGD